MLVLSRKKGEKVWIGEDICITVVDIDRRQNKIRLGFECPRDIPIYREEIRPSAIQTPAADYKPQEIAQ